VLRHGVQRLVHQLPELPARISGAARRRDHRELAN
jgi:hypothetical protein